MTRTVALVRALGAESSRPKRRFGASAIAGMAAAAFVVLVVRPGCVADPSPPIGSRNTRSVAAVTARQSGDVAAFSQAGAEAALRRGATADQHIRAEPDRRDADLRQPQRLGRRRYRLRFAQRPARQTQKARPTARTPHDRAAAAGDDIHAGADLQPGCAATAAPQQIKVPPPEVYPLRAAKRVGATLPPPPPPLQEELVNNPPPEVHPLAAANRPGSSLPAPGPQFYTYAVSSYLPDYVANPPPPNLQPPNTFALGQRPQRLLPILAEPDPYAALGIRAGSFILLPSLDFSGAASTNPEHIPGGPPAAYVVAAPELIVRSDWERHSLTADIAGSWTQYTQDLVPSLNVPYMNSRVDGRIDVTRDTAINLQLRGIINTDNPGSPNTQFGVAQLPINFDVGQTVGITQQFNRLTVSFKGTFDRTTYNPSLLTDGEYSSNADRNFDQYGGIGRIAYELDPGLRPFVQVEGDQRVHDEPFDRNNLQRESVGITGKVGAAVNMFGSLTGEMAIGYVDRVYKDPTLPNVAGVIGDGAVLWQPSALTSAKLSATSQIYETTSMALPGSSAAISRSRSIMPSATG